MFFTKPSYALSGSDPPLHPHRALHQLYHVLKQRSMKNHPDCFLKIYIPGPIPEILTEQTRALRLGHGAVLVPCGNTPGSRPSLTSTDRSQATSPLGPSIGTSPSADWVAVSVPQTSVPVGGSEVLHSERSIRKPHFSCSFKPHF